MLRRLLTISLILCLSTSARAVAEEDIPINEPPVANNDDYDTFEDDALSVCAFEGVLKNDTDADDDPLSAVKWSDPMHGTVNLIDNGSLTYTPDQNYFGLDSFTYKAFDGLDFSNIATVSLSIESVNDVPVAMDDSYSLDKNTTLIVYSYAGVLANDFDVEGPLTAIKVTEPKHGSLNLYSSGGFVYTPDPSFYGLDSFLYHAFDGEASSNDAAVIFEVIPEPGAATLALSLLGSLCLACFGRRRG